MSHEKYIEGIRRTGFDLEYRASELLRAHRWTVLNNKYYVDDAHETVREIDIVAYKAHRVNDFHVYTTLIASCKKSERNAWALLARNRDPSDPNLDWHPLHAWSNHKAVGHMLQEATWREELVRRADSTPANPVFSVPEKQVFAFQELNKTTGKPDNDKNIFASVISLMKAQAYEIDALPRRKRAPVVYQFNLISIVDADMLRMSFAANGSLSCEPIDQAHFLAGYIISKQQTSARVRFVTFNVLDSVLSEYDALCQVNIDCFSGLYDSFYATVLEDYGKSKILLPDLVAALSSPVLWWLRHHHKEVEADADSISVSLTKKPTALARLHIPAPQETVDEMNANVRFRQALGKAFKAVFRYDGASQFDVVDEYDIPF